MALQGHPDELRIVAGERYLQDYAYGAHVAHHYFCRRCGVHPFDRVDLSPPRDPYYNVSVVCVDGVDIDELLSAPIHYQDGRNDVWEQTPKETRHL